MTDNTTRAADDARIYFPRGLNQPEGSFKFSMDALLLAGFVQSDARLGKAGDKNFHILDLGCGCGVIGLALLLAFNGTQAEPRVTGVEIDPELIACATENAQMLALAERFSALEWDIRELVGKKGPFPPESFDLVTSNPPFRRADQGRLPATTLRENALFEGSARLNDFVRTAAFALKNRGAFYCIWSSERLTELVCELKAHRLEPKLLLPVQARAHKGCSLVLVKAVKNGRPGLKLKAPLLVYELNENSGDKAKEPNLTRQVLEFCPWLACNAKL